MNTPTEYFLRKDGNAWCAHGPNFINLQESLAAFDDTPVKALHNFIHEEEKAEALRCEKVRDWKCNCCRTVFSAGRVPVGQAPPCPWCKAGSQYTYEINETPKTDPQ